MLKYLTEYRKRENNIKLMDLLDFEFKELSDLFKTIEDWRDVETAEGAVLDQIGQEVGQLRRGATDEVYRFLIKAKILSNNSRGDVYSIVNVISTVLGLEPGEFQIAESYHGDIKLAGMIEVTEVPLSVMLESGLSTEEFIELIKATLAAGVGLEKLELAGTFQFSDKLVTDHDRGFGDIDMTTGGTIGQVFGGGDEYGI